jgi:hypothetical protein
MWVFFLLFLLSFSSIKASSSSSSSSPSSSILELDLVTFRTLLLQDTDRDSLIFFYFSNGAQAANSAASEVARHLHLDASSSIRVALLDCTLHGIPSGLHLHSPQTSLYLFPALEKEPILFVNNHNHDYHDHDHDHHHDHGQDDDHHHHSHDHNDHDHNDSSTSSSPSSSTPFQLSHVIDFLREHTTFKAEVPPISLSQRWAGRSSDLWKATANGLRALQDQMEELQLEIKSLKNQLSNCQAGAATAEAAGKEQERKARGSNKIEL